MSAVVIVQGVLEGLELVETLIANAAQVSSAIRTAQASGQPVQLSSVIASVTAAENAALAAINSDPNQT